MLPLNGSRPAVEIDRVTMIYLFMWTFFNVNLRRVRRRGETYCNTTILATTKNTRRRGLVGTFYTRPFSKKKKKPICISIASDRSILTVTDSFLTVREGKSAFVWKCTNCLSRSRCGPRCLTNTQTPVTRYIRRLIICLSVSHKHRVNETLIMDFQFFFFTYICIFFVRYKRDNDLENWIISKPENVLT